MAPAEVVSAGAFISTQSLLSFPVAVWAAQTVWLLIRTIFPDWTAIKWGPGALGFLLGLAITIFSLSDPELSYSRREKAWFALVGLINSSFLAAAAMGLAINPPPGVNPAGGQAN